ncbi:MAG TPA: hypothetical protein VFT29_05100 [Gemmatimonadaceae bacterium]|nr:hypothetical protein [Gemmatimonadaceae bacterium]
MRAFKLVLALVLVLGIVAVVLELATAPLYAVYDAHDCRQAYAHARSLADSTRVDLHLYGGADKSVRHTCGEVRARSALDISALRQPDERQ